MTAVTNARNSLEEWSEGSNTPSGQNADRPRVKRGMSNRSLDPSPLGNDRLLNTQVSSNRLDSCRRSHKSTLLEKSRMEAWRTRCRILIDSWRFNVMTTVLTFYALFGTDFQLATTPKKFENFFNVLTMLCILVFTVELLASSIGKKGYFLGFFFWLDLFATATLIFDFSWVTEAIICDLGNQARSGRAGRAGARAARTVRVIRLIRLAKLYKMTIEQRERKKRQELERSKMEAMPELLPGEDGAFHMEEDNEDVLSDKDDEELLDMDNEANQAGGSETRVGKKLADMTTRRVIFLVLSMLVLLPLFEPSFFEATSPTSDVLSGDIVDQKWKSWCGSSSPGGAPQCLSFSDPKQALSSGNTTQPSILRAYYEQALLHNVYYHTPVDGQQEGRDGNRLYWLGVSSSTKPIAYMGEIAAVSQLPRSLWDAMFNNASRRMELGTLASSIQRRLSEPWVERCDFEGFDSFAGVSLSETADTRACSVFADLRCTEMVTQTAKSTEVEFPISFIYTYDKRAWTRLEAYLSVGQTIFISIMVAVGAMVFSHDANVLLLNPIERMMAKMETIKDNPLEAMRLGDREYRREELEKQRQKEILAKKSRFTKWFHRLRTRSHTKEPMETVILEKTIIKLGSLLALGFGEAGAEIIGQNMKGGDSAGVSAVIPGQKVDAIIGFCTIGNFTIATEVLKEKVMLFVNMIGEIIHGCVDDYHGAPNKNIGDAFLLVWRMSGLSTERQKKLADMSIMAFVKIIANINKSPVLAEYREHPGLLQRLPNYRVSLGFGLHCGWTIEGAIGSEFKIDASYLSPNVNVAARLDSASSQYGVCILMSHFLMALCNKEMKAYCRLIDHVTVKGSKQPVRLYTIDLDYMCLEVQHRSMARYMKNRFKIRQVREARKNEKCSDDYQVWDDFSSDDDLVDLRASYTSEFFQRFSMAYRNYEAGAWMVARDMLLTCYYDVRHNRRLSIDEAVYNSSNPPPPLGEDGEWPPDGPATTLLNYMKQTCFVAPPAWPGYRELSNK